MRKILKWMLYSLITILFILFSIYRIPVGEPLIISGDFNKSLEGKGDFRGLFEQVMGNYVVVYHSKNKTFTLYVNEKDIDAISKHYEKCSEIAINSNPNGVYKFQAECRNKASFRVQTLLFGGLGVAELIQLI